MMRTSGTFTRIGIVLLALVQANAAYDPDYPGPYCEASRDGCCNNREDECSMPISTTFCYCDQFCNRGTSGDCCPDYESFCLGVGPANMTVATCTTPSGERFTPFDGPVRENCNLCRCNAAGELQCDSDLCLVDEALLHNVNRRGDTLGWQARNYTQFWARKYADGLRLRLGTFEPKHRVKAMSKMHSSGEGPSLPREFNAMLEWGDGLITPVRDQGWCGSSWALSTAAVASDRFAVQSKGQEAVVLAPQQMLSCVRRQQGCGGGHLDVAWNYFRKVGIVDDACFPYIEGTNRCRVRHTDTLSSVGCRQQTNVARRSLYKMGPAYSLRDETDIMLEIQTSGPVQATMRVYRDFFSYSNGVYKHTAASRSDPSGFHSVRLLGWGEESDGYSVTKYWIAANTWGTWWGEDGLFRIVRGTNECEIENYVLASWADVTTAKQHGDAYSRAAHPLFYHPRQQQQQQQHRQHRQHHQQQQQHHGHHYQQRQNNNYY